VARCKSDGGKQTEGNRHRGRDKEERLRGRDIGKRQREIHRRREGGNRHKGAQT
jgi:hypothetical protein